MLAAATAGDGAAATTALKAGADVDAADFNRRTALMLASMKRHLDVVKLMLAAGAHVDSADASGRTPLMEASMRGEVDIMQALLDARAD